MHGSISGIEIDDAIEIAEKIGVSNTRAELSSAARLSIVEEGQMCPRSQFGAREAVSSRRVPRLPFRAGCARSRKRPKVGPDYLCEAAAGPAKFDVVVNRGTAALLSVGSLHARRCMTGRERESP